MPGSLGSASRNSSWDVPVAAMSRAELRSAIAPRIAVAAWSAAARANETLSFNNLSSIGNIFRGARQQILVRVGKLYRRRWRLRDQGRLEPRRQQLYETERNQISQASHHEHGDVGAGALQDIA